MTPRILGAVLAGGRSSRFGSDKALAVVGGTSLLDHAAALLRPLVAEVVTVGRDGGIVDRPTAGLGPLGGIAGALAWAQGHGFDSVMTAGCDMPLIPVALLRSLREALPSYCPDAPVLGHWPVTAATDLLDLLGSAQSDGNARGDRKNSALSVRRWAQAIGANAIPTPAALHNVNTPADLPAW